MEGLTPDQLAKVMASMSPDDIARTVAEATTIRESQHVEESNVAILTMDNDLGELLEQSLTTYSPPGTLATPEFVMLEQVRRDLDTVAQQQRQLIESIDKLKPAPKAPRKKRATGIKADSNG